MSQAAALLSPRHIAAWMAQRSNRDRVVVNLRCSREAEDSARCIVYADERQAVRIAHAIGGTVSGATMAVITIPVSRQFGCRGRNEGRLIDGDCTCRVTGLRGRT